MLEFIEILQHVDLFKGLTSENIEDLLIIDSYYIKEYKKNSVIYFQNEKCITLDIVLKGVVSIEGIDDKGNYVAISDFSTGNLIGGNLVFSHKNFYPMIVLARTDVTILHLKRDLVLKLCQNNYNFLINFLASLSDKTLILADRIKTLSFKSLRKSIIDFLIYESYSQKSTKIKLRLTKKSLAEKFGVQRTSLSRELNKMREDGLIDYDAYSITIIDKDLLMNF
ncbi:Crp/Fnr family transcriptional regulator [Clostridium sporogenes]|uniref:Crp/Fnr family transcriptional regulator n=1 Tax=Clostridium sporogenes TaxID=1509 RepID=A0A7X5PBU9_CLOSG|nr:MULTISPECIES: Crp/Fnr family transcriptional regulator [Clostridium]AJD30097.1 cyclic nucleotide-binding domain protein [Clostridium botulinum Prevot_594]EHN15131.1 transcriptional regulator, Crp/Fnr family protein [Clostridium sporogenes PA 3679]KOY67561.1 transcriptional regulator [Clostridium sporogenes]KRU41517.1 cAMP-binding protein [Clostridium sporogenes]KYN77732.1 transcriptional regulator [Clostridium sporogenes]